MLNAKDIMTRNIITIEKNKDVGEICGVLIKNKLSGIPVVDKKDHLIGFISERDIIANMSVKGFLKKKVKDIMTKEVISVDYDVPAEEIARIFTEKPIRHIPVIRGKRVVGIISRRDIINKLLGQYY